MKRNSFFWLLMLCSNFISAQDLSVYTFRNPAADTNLVIEGQGWPKEVTNYYDRLPARAQSQVRKPVWDLSKNSAGLQLRFTTDADELVVRYKVSGALQLPHMPATGVSGLDLYVKDANGKWLWSAGKFSFGDTIVYRFPNLNSVLKNKTYTLYLPLYNSVQQLEIGTPKQNAIHFLPVRREKPIVVYGTSIAQGACASRPGLAWTSILGRMLDKPVINLAFSGNGRMEKEVVDLLTEIDAKLYVLDCLPNLVSAEYTDEEIKKRYLYAVTELQNKRPAVPILLTEHDGYTDEGVNGVRGKEYRRVNAVLHQTYQELIKAGRKNVYLLSKEEINQDIETMVDGVHPNDAGMLRYANAYYKAIRRIFK